MSVISHRSGKLKESLVAWEIIELCNKQKLKDKDKKAILYWQLAVKTLNNSFYTDFILVMQLPNKRNQRNADR